VAEGDTSFFGLAIQRPWKAEEAVGILQAVLACLCLLMEGTPPILISLWLGLGDLRGD
jgi:hypothetical protein